MKRLALSSSIGLAVVFLAGCMSWEVPLLAEPTTTYIERLKSNTPKDLRREAILKLRERGKSESPEIQAKILEVLQVIIRDPKEDPLIKSAAITTAEQLGGGVVAPTLVAALDDKYAIVRVDATHALGRMALPSTEEALIRTLLEDPVPSVRVAAAKSLRNFPSRNSIAALIQSLDDSDRAVAMNGRESLKRITGKDPGATSEAWRQWWRESEPVWK